MIVRQAYTMAKGPRSFCLALILIEAAKCQAHTIWNETRMECMFLLPHNMQMIMKWSLALPPNGPFVSQTLKLPGS